MSRTIDFKFSDKHKNYMRRALDCCINVAEGAVRAGKTVDNVFCFAYLLEHSPDVLHLATGSTVSNAMINIGDCNGLGLEHIFRGRCRYRKFKGCDALEIDAAVGKRYVLFAGAGKADSYKKIRGNSYGMWIATEINLHNPMAVKEAFNRQLAAKMRKIFWDLNPENPKAWIYREYIDRYAEASSLGKLSGGYNYEHFTIFDNLSVSPERIQEIVGQYDKNSIWFKRDILGQRCSAEGLVYPLYPEISDRLTVDLSDAEVRAQYAKGLEFIDVGIDFGGNRSLTTFVATGIHRGSNTFTVLSDGCIDGAKGEIDPNRVYREVEEFLKRLTNDYPSVRIAAIRPDSAEQYLIAGLRQHLRYRFPEVAVIDSRKRPIIDRIRALNSMISEGRFFIEKRCQTVDDGIRSARWDERAAQKGDDRRADDFSSNIDIMDALEYSFECHIERGRAHNAAPRSAQLSSGVYAADFTGGWNG